MKIIQKATDLRNEDRDDVKEMNKNVQLILASGEKLQKQIFKETIRIIKI